MPTTLVPRPETETVVEAALAALGERARNARCASPISAPASGALLLALLRELPGCARCRHRYQRRPRSRCARSNAAALGFAGRASFVACDHGAALAAARVRSGGRKPALYGERRDRGLAPEVRDFDPRRALDGGADGLAAYRAIAGDARRLLAPHGVLVLELGAGQLDAVDALTAAAGLGR